MTSRWFLAATLAIAIATVEATNSDVHGLATAILVAISWCAGAGFGLNFATESAPSSGRKDDLLRRAHGLLFVGEQLSIIPDEYKTEIRDWIKDHERLSSAASDDAPRQQPKKGKS